MVKHIRPLMKLIKLTDLQIGHVNVYTIERDGKTLTVSVTNKTLGIKRVFIQSGLFWIFGMHFLWNRHHCLSDETISRGELGFSYDDPHHGNIHHLFSAQLFFIKPPWLQAS